MIKYLAILGSTGSIGKQTINLVRQDENIRITLLAAHSNANLLIEQALEFLPNIVVIANESKYQLVKNSLRNTGIQVMTGEKAMIDVLSYSNIDTVLITLVGFAGLLPLLEAIKNKKTILLATKEVFVVAGDLIISEAKKHNVAILPVDSEHSGVLQCMQGENWSDVEKVFLTASGGPFFGYDHAQLQHVTLEQALKHPRWSMGKKITVDSATLMNKGFEVIEAVYFFSINADKVEVLIHPQSIVHAMVQYIDGTLKAQLGWPDMRTSIAYALYYPERKKINTQRVNFVEMSKLEFYKPDRLTFPCLQYAYDVLQAGGSAPCVLNAANEVAVEAFLSKKIAFNQISQIISSCLENHEFFISTPALEDLIYVNQITRKFAQEIVRKCN